MRVVVIAMAEIKFTLQIQSFVLVSLTGDGSKI
jgi:hypothetical protein